MLKVARYVRRAAGAGDVSSAVAGRARIGQQRFVLHRRGKL